MNRATLLSLALLVVPTALTAQTTNRQPTPAFIVLSNDQHQTQTIIVQLPPPNSVCPVFVHAQQASGAGRMEVDNARPLGLAQLLHLTLINPDSSRVTGATVTVRGLTPKTRTTLTLTTQSDASNAARTLDITFPAGPEKDVSSDLWVPGLSAVYSINLVSVTYADGSAWKLATGKTCLTPIDGVMLISGR
jgi:hypothetical protein